MKKCADRAEISREWGAWIQEIQAAQERSLSSWVRRIQWSPYELKPLSRFSRLSAPGVRRGALLKVEFYDEKVGYADCHPWTELGDEPLEDQLHQLIRRGQTTRLTQCSLQMARIDAQGRAQGHSLVEGDRVPESHCLMGSCLNLSADSIFSCRDQGFRFLKLKMGLDWETECLIIQKNASALKESGIKLRLDFNSGCRFSDESRDGSPSVHGVLDQLSACFQQIDWIEDPTPYDPRSWQRIQESWGVPIAFDQPLGFQWNQMSFDSFQVLILKPAVQSLSQILNLIPRLNQPVCVTSYLDHPLGQVSAAWVASLFPFLSHPMLACGLLSHSVYEQNSYSRELKTQGPRLLGVSGTGFGMDELLNANEWS
ncbi:MAG: enolase C-terminal domain-like protein [Bdellovibrionia bacterium]